jgi:hypothetical protein
MDMEIVKYLEGKKTYLACALGLFLIAAVSLGWITIPKERVQEIVNGVTLVAIAALRASK